MCEDWRLPLTLLFRNHGSDIIGVLLGDMVAYLRCLKIASQPAMEVLNF
jgi:hypothetical protein